MKMGGCRNTGSLSQVKRNLEMRDMIYENKPLSQKLLAILLVVALLVSLAPASVSYADESYDFQPEGSDKDSTVNGMKMIDVCGLTNFIKLEETEDSYINQIDGIIDGTVAHKIDTSDQSGTYNLEGDHSGIYFTFTMSAGMNNFQKDFFLNGSDQTETANMDQIKIYKADTSGKETGEPVAEYSRGNGLLEFWGSHQTEEISNQGGNKTDKLYIGVAQGVLGTGDYIIVFGRNICGNNVDKQLGKDIKFRFSVKAAPELSEMIQTARDFVQSAAIHESDPGTWRQEDVDQINRAIEEAVAVQESSASDEEREAAAETLYTALSDFKAAVNFRIDGISINGISDEIQVGDSGTASASVTVQPDDAQFKRVSWSAYQYTQGDPEDGPAEEIPADNLSINASSGNWVALYSGPVWIKATSLKDETCCEYKKVEVVAEEGVLAVNLAEKDARVSDLIPSVLQGMGKTEAEVQSVKVFTTGAGAMTAEDLDYLNGLPSLQTLNLKNATLEEVSASAFRDHPTLEEVVLPDTVTTISQRAFYNCAKLRTVEIPASVASIGGGAFAGCTSLSETLVIHAVYPPTYTTNAPVSGDSFEGGSSDPDSPVTTIQVPYGCSADYKAKQGWRAFKIVESPKQTLEVHFTQSGTLAQEAQEELNAQGITDSEVTDLKISSPEGVQLSRADDVNGWLQTHCLYATTIDLSDTEFENNKCNANTFKERISLKYIDLPESTTTIGGTCFYGCKNLRQIRLPEALENMGSGAFGGCEMAGDSVIVGAEIPPTYDGQVFPDCVKTMIVPPQSVEAYEKATGWGSYTIQSQVALALSAKTMSLEAGKTGSLTATVTVYNNNVDTVTWESSNSRVASVSPERGRTTTITAEKAGTATITAKAANGHVTAACTVTVRDLAAPASAKASSPAYNKVKVSWSGVSGAQGYIVYRSTKKSSGYSQIRTLSSSARSYTDTGLKTGTTYYYRVRAYKEQNNTRYLGEYSSVASAKPTLAKAKKVKAKRAGKRKIRVSWKRVTGANGYKVYRSTKKKKGFKAVKTVKSGKTVKYTTGKLKKGKRYYFKVRAYRTVSGKKVYSAWSSRVSCKAR